MGGESYHLIGAGGAGMSALARILLARGCSVSGSDMHDGPVVQDLIAHGAEVHVGHRAENLNGAGVVVASAAIKECNPEIRRAREKRVPILSRAELLGRIMETRRSVGVTGTHGKSTTSGMLASLLLHSGWNPTVLLGADLPEIGGNAHCGDPDLVVAEVCEAYDSFLSVHPTHAVLTNVEPDHLDYYRTFDRLVGSFRQFVRQIKPDGALIGCQEDPVVRDLLSGYPGRVLSYGFGSDSLLRATDVEASPTGMRYRLTTPDGVFPVQLSVPGRHNVLNSMGAMAAAGSLGLPWEQAARSIKAFCGTGRRLELVGEGNGIQVYDDYAHHPTEIRTTLEAVREALKPQRLITLFQPHLYSRTQQFLDAFAEAFIAPDFALFMEIYGAREEPMPGVSGRLLAERAEFLRPDATTEFVGSHNAAVRRVLSLTAPGDLVLCLGAGDITSTAREIGAGIGLPARRRGTE